MAGGKIKPFVASRLTNGEKQVLTHSRIKPPAMDRDLAREYLLTVKEIFDRHKVKFWLIFGTLLGAVRDGGFIEGDKDIDLATYESDAEKRFPAILELQKAGLKVIRTNPYDNSFQVKRGWICIDFGSVWRHKDNMWRYGRFFEPRDFFSEFIEWPFLGTTFLIPKNYEEYLELHYYGDRWKKPDPKCKHAKLFRLNRRYL